MKVDVELQNHPLFDGMADKLARLRTRKAGETQPLHRRHGPLREILVGHLGNLIQAEIARRGNE